MRDRSSADLADAFSLRIVMSLMSLHQGLPGALPQPYEMQAIEYSVAGSFFFIITFRRRKSRSLSLYVFGISLLPYPIFITATRSPVEVVQ
jgi:hypothetical protein